MYLQAKQTKKFTNITADADLQISPDGKIFTYLEDNTLWLVRGNNSTDPDEDVVDTAQTEILFTGFSADSQAIIVGHAQGDLEFIDVTSKKILNHNLAQGSVDAAVQDPISKIVYVSVRTPGGGDSSLWGWKLGKPLIKILDLKDGSFCMDINQHGQVLLSGPKGLGLVSGLPPTGSLSTNVIEQIQKDYVRLDDIPRQGITFSNNGELAVAAHRGMIELWDTKHKKKVTEWEGAKDNIWSLRFLPGDKAVAAVSLNAKFCIWDITGKKLKENELHEPSTQMEVLTNGMPVTITREGTVQYWNTQPTRLVSMEF